MGQLGSILIADPHPLDRLGLASICRDCLGLRTIEADNLARAEALISADPSIGMVASALDLPGMKGGVAALREFRMRVRHVRFVVIGPPVGRDFLLDILATGVDGYIPKSMEVSQISNALTSVHSGRAFFPEAPRSPPVSVGSAQQPALRCIQEVLTSRQIEVLRALSEGRSNKQIARALAISESTVKVHLNAAFHALGVHNRQSALQALLHLAMTTYEGDPVLLQILRAGKRDATAQIIAQLDPTEQDQSLILRP